MPVPKRKLSRARRDSRQANKAIKPGSVALCKECAAPLIPHQACLVCGFYKGRKIIKTKAERHLERSQARVSAQAKPAEQQGQSSESTSESK